QGGDVQGVTELLNRHVPAAGETDRRGFEWGDLRRQSHRAHRVLLDAEAPLYTLCHSPDRKLLATPGKDATVRLLDPQTGEISREIVTGQIEVNGVAFSPDGGELATAGDDGTIRVWNLKSGAERLQFKAHPEKAFQVAYSPDGTQIIS